MLFEEEEEEEEEEAGCYVPEAAAVMCLHLAFSKWQ